MEGYSGSGANHTILSPVVVKMESPKYNPSNALGARTAELTAIAI
jgi:hypothetical protein